MGALEYDNERGCIKLPDQNERRRLMNSMPNELRALVKRVEQAVVEADELHTHGVVLDSHLATFFQLVYLSLAENPNNKTLLKVE